MSALPDLAGLLNHWSELTQAEGVAIASANWSAVEEIQSRKASLKLSLAEARAQWQKDNPGALPKTLRVEIARLISQETRNGELLAAQMRRGRERREELDQAKRNLHKVQGSYARRQSSGSLHYYS